MYKVKKKVKIIVIKNNVWNKDNIDLLFIISNTSKVKFFVF